MTEEKLKLTRYEKIVEHIMSKYRWIFVIFFLLPLSLIYDRFVIIRNWLVFQSCSAPRAHDRKVKFIQQQVREWNTNGRTTKMCTARSGWQTMSFRFPLYKDKMTKIRTDQLVDILGLDEENMTVKVEPMVTMGQLTKYLVPLGYTLPIVPELDDLTVGGMINGCGVEASGRKYGMFQHICQSYELVLADGEVVTVEKSRNTENDALFHGIPWSHGTIAFLTAANIRIIKCKPFVKLVYTPTNNLDEMCTKLNEEAMVRENEFVEGLLFTKSKGCVMKGRFSDGPSTDEDSINRIGAWHKKWFYTQVEDIVDAGKVVTEFIPLRDYYHRHSKSIFWELKEIVPFGNNVIFRWLFGWMCPPKISFLKATTTSTLRRLYDRQHVLQDMLVPITNLKETIEVFHNEVEVYPIWLCPFMLPNCPGMLKIGSEAKKMFVDVGAYGITTKPTYHPVNTTRKIEEFVRSVKGFQMLYADTYMSASEFWEMFDSSIYHYLRSKYNCRHAFPDVYEKVCRAARY